MSANYNWPIPVRIRSALGEYEYALGVFDEWISRRRNKLKHEIFSIVHSVVQRMKEEGEKYEDIFPSYEELMNGADSFVDREKYFKYWIGSNDFNFSDEETLEEYSRKTSRLKGYRHGKRYIEATAYKLVKELEKEAFLQEMDSLHIEKQAQWRNRLAERLQESYIGRSFFVKCSIHTTPGKPLPIFHYKRLEQEADYLNTLGSAGKFSSLVANLSENLIEYAPTMANFALSTGALPEARKAVYKTAHAIANQFANGQLGTLSDFLQNELQDSNPFSSSSRFKSATTKFKRFIIARRDEYFPLDTEEGTNRAIRNDATDIFKKLKGGLALLELMFAFEKMAQDPSAQNIRDFTLSMVGTLDTLNEIPKFRLNKRAPTLAKGIKVGGTAAAAVGVILSAMDSYEAFENDDYSVSIGHGLSAYGSVLMLIPSPFTLIVGSILLIVGFLITTFTADALTERWFHANYFGKQWNPNFNGNPEDFEFRFNENFERQIAKFYSILYAPKLDTVRLVKTIRTAETAIFITSGSTANLVGPLKQARQYLRDHGGLLQDTYYELFFVLDEPNFIAQTIDMRVYLWDDTAKDFFHQSDRFRIRPVREEGSRAPLPNHWKDDKLIFVWHKLNVDDTGNETKIKRYECAFLVRRDLINDGSRLTHMEIRFYMRGTSRTRLDRSTMRLAAGKEVGIVHF